MLRALTIVMVAIILTGCQTTNPNPVSEISENEILAAAEPVIQAQYPEAYVAYKPYIAVPIPDTQTWRVIHFSKPTPKGSPTAIVHDDGRVLSVSLTE